jgi:hypothetical protein
MAYFVSRSAIRAYLRKPKGFEAWFYTGPTRHFGHAPPKKRRS